MVDRRTRSLTAYTLACSQVFLLCACRQEGGSSRRDVSAAASTAAAANAGGVNMGALAYEVLHAGYVHDQATAQADALELYKDPFISSVNRIVTPDVGAELIPTFLSLLTMVDDGTVSEAGRDLDAILVDLTQDPQALAAVVALLRSSPGSGPASMESNLVLLSRLLNNPEIDGLWIGLVELLRAHDGLDDQGQPNGERNLLRELQVLASGLLSGAQTSSSSPQQGAQALRQLARSLLSPNPLPAFSNLGDPAWIVRLDRHGNPQVQPDGNGLLPLPFTDDDLDGVADVDAEGTPVDLAGVKIEIPAFAEQGPDRDLYGRALTSSGTLYYDYVDAKRTLLSEVLLLLGQLLGADATLPAVRLLAGASDRVTHDNQTPSDTSDDYETLDPNDPLVDLAHAQFELIKRTALPELLAGIAVVVQNDPHGFAEIVDALAVSLRDAKLAAQNAPAMATGTTSSTTPSAGNAATATPPTSLGQDLLPLLQDALSVQGNNTSAVRALLEAFNTQQRQLQNLPPAFARMMRFHDYGQRIPADATHPSIMQRILDMMARANNCNAVGLGNMAEFYLDAMAGNRRILGITIGIDTIHNLLDISFLRNLLCSQIRPDDVRALQDFNDTGALDAMKPIAQVFSQRGETELLKEIMLGLGAHYETTLRPSEPTVVAVLESGAVERIFHVLDAMTRVPVPNSNLVVADALADTLQALVDPQPNLTDRAGNAVPTLLHLLLAPTARIRAKAQARGLGADLAAATQGLGAVLLSTFMDDNGTPNDLADDVERWTWQGLGATLGHTLATAAAAIPADPADRQRWATQHQAQIVDTLTRREVTAALDLLLAIAESPHKQAINRALAGLFTPSTVVGEDAFGALLSLLGEKLTVTANVQTPAVNSQTLDALLHFLGRQLDPQLGRADGIARLLFGVLGADHGRFVLDIARNALSMGATGRETPPVFVLREILNRVAAAGGPAPSMTSASLTDTLLAAHTFLTDVDHGLPYYVERLKNRPRR